jgi:hypothetical protein
VQADPLPFVAFLALSLSACSSDRTADTATTAPRGQPADAPTLPSTGGGTLAGWYMEHGGASMFQRCGESTQLRVDSAVLRDAAKASGLDAGSPIYVRVVGSIEGSTLVVTNVAQVGSPTPVRDCGLTGVVMPAGG